MGSYNHRTVIVICPDYHENQVQSYFDENFIENKEYTKSPRVINGFIQFTVHTCGSKAEWEADCQHKDKCQALVDFCKSLRYEDGSTSVKAILVETKELWNGSDFVSITDQSVSEIIGD